MVTLKCKECGKEFSYEKMSSCKAQLKRHLQSEHNMSVLEYVVKYEYNGVRPKCPCGCGHELNLAQNGDKWRFTKYFSDTCYGEMVRMGNEEVMRQYQETHMREFDIVKYYEMHYDRKTYEEAFQLLKTKQLSLSDVSKSYNIDKRTLKKVWLAMKITDAKELTEILEYTKYQLSPVNRITNTLNNEDVLSWVYNLITKFPGKYTPHSLCQAYNDFHQDTPTNIKSETICKALYKRYGDAIDLYLANGLHSSEEYMFYQILSFYIPDYRIKLGKKFILGETYVYYDFLVGSKLLIEYDSDGYFHSTADALTKDKQKEAFALDNGYKFLRLTKKDIKDIGTINKIKEILDETN